MLNLIFLAKTCYISLIVFSIYCLYLKYYLNKTFAKYFFLSSLAFLIGIVLIQLRYNISNFYSIVIANTVLTLGEIYLYIAVKKLLGYNESSWKNRYLIPLLVIFLGYILFTYLFFNLAMRMIVFSLFFILYHGIMAWMFWNRKNGYNKINKISSIVFLIGCIIFVFRAISSTIIDLNANYLSNTYFFILLPYLYLLFSFSWLLFLIYQYSKKG